MCTENRNCLECALSKRIYLLLPLLRTILSAEPFSFESPVLFCPDCMEKRVYPHTSLLLRSWLKSMRSFCWNLLVDLPGITFPQWNCSMTQIRIQCGIEIDMMYGISLSEAIMCSGTVSLFGSSIVFLFMRTHL